MSIPNDLSKLSNVVKNDVVKKADYNKLVTKVDNIDTCGFVLKTSDTEKSELENKIPDITGLVKKTDYNTKISEIEGKIPDITNLATKHLIDKVENRIPSISNSIKKKQTIILKLQKLKIRLIIIIMINILILQSLII